jgi:hypothetical protein
VEDGANAAQIDLQQENVVQQQENEIQQMEHTAQKQ